MLDGKLALATLLALGAICSPAAAQEARKLDFGVRLAARHDSNLARSNATTAAVRGITPEDYIFTPAATFDLVLPVSRQSFFVRGSAGYDYYRENTQLNSARYDVESGLNGRFGACSGTVMTAYHRSQSDLQDLTIVNPKNVLELTNLTAQVGCQRQAGLGVSGSVGHVWATNSNRIQSQSDYEADQASAELSYGRPTLGSLTTFLQYQKTEYKDAGPLLGRQNGYELLAGGVSYERRIGSRLQGRVSVSQSQVDPIGILPGGGGGGDSYSGVTYSGDLTYRPTDRMEAMFEYSRAIVPSTQRGTLYDLDESYRLSGKYKVGSRIVAMLGGERRESTAEGTLGGPPIGGNFTESRTVSLFGSLSFQQNDRLSYLLDIIHEERTTNDPRFDYSATRIGLTADVAF